MGRPAPLILVSNRGPVTFARGPDGELRAPARRRRPGDGADGPDRALARAVDLGGDLGRRRGGRRPGRRRQLRAAGPRRRHPRPLRDDRPRRPTTPTTTWSPTRCCGSSSTTSGTSATRPTCAARRRTPGRTATWPPTPPSPRRSTRSWRSDPDRVVMLHDYHLYTAPEGIRAEHPDAFLHFFVHIPWSQPDYWRILPPDVREAILRGLLANDIIAFHTRRYARNFLLCCEDLLDLAVDYERLQVRWEGRDVWVRHYPISVNAPMFEELAHSPEVAEEEGPMLRRRRQYLVVRVDRTDLSKNTLRGFKAFDVFLDRHPEFHEDITFFALLQPSRQDVDEYVEYLSEDRGRRQPHQHQARQHRLDADRPAHREQHPPRGGGLQALRRAGREPDLRRHEPDRQGGPARQRARRRDDPLRERRRPRGAGLVRALDQPVRRRRAGRRPPPRARDARRRAGRPHPRDQAHRARERRGQVALGPAGRHRQEAHGRPPARASAPGRERTSRASPTSTSAARRGWWASATSPPSARRAVAEAVVRMAPESARAISEGALPEGRRGGRRARRGHHGRQADARADRAVPPAADRPGRRRRRGRRRARARCGSRPPSRRPPAPGSRWRP